MFQPAKDLPGGYRLVIFESSSYYIDRGGGGHGGVLGGSISQLGWTDRYIVAWRESWWWHKVGDGVGWMIIDVASGTIEGPLSPEEFETRRRKKALHDIQIYTADEAWKRLS